MICDECKRFTWEYHGCPTYCDGCHQCRCKEDTKNGCTIDTGREEKKN